MQTARLILDPPAPGSWNMAVDEALLLSAAERSSLTLRLYQWQVPTLSLGYFQPHRLREQHPASRHCPLVRRASGGGAILHDRELTYSLTGPVPTEQPGQLLTWYDIVHRAWQLVLSDHAAPALLCPATDSDREQSFLCFQRRSAGDLLVGAQKVGGSAQRRHRQAALQHGSLLLAASLAAPELPGLQELTGHDWCTGDWRDQWIAALGAALDVRWVPSSLTDREAATARRIEQEKFRDEKWTLRR